MLAFSLEGRAAIVTGSSRGLGRAIGFGLARAGCDVVIASRNLDACRAAAEDIMATTGRRAIAHACHVGHWEELEPLLDAALDAFGRLDVLVNNAGLNVPSYPLDSVSEAAFDKMIGVNLKGPFRLSALAGTRMQQTGGGSIINVSSAAAIRPEGSSIPYAAAKAGLNAMTIGLAAALGPSVRVNCLVPGAFDTDMLRSSSVYEAYGAWACRHLALGRIGTSDEIAGAAIFLASSASSYVTGAVLDIHGGIPSGLAPKA